MRLSELSRIYPFHFNCPHLLSTPIKSVLGRQSTEERTLGFVLWPPAAESSGSPREENTLLPGRSWTLLQFIYRQIRTGDTQGRDILNLHLHSTTTNSLFYPVRLGTHDAGKTSRYLNQREKEQDIFCVCLYKVTKFYLSSFTLLWETYCINWKHLLLRVLPY